VAEEPPADCSWLVEEDDVADSPEPEGSNRRAVAGDAFAPDDVVSAAQAAEVLGVTEDRIPVLVDEGLLDPIATPDGSMRFLRVDVEAVRLQGG